MNTEIMAATSAVGTKLVRIQLAALTRVEYTELVEVPADVTDEELGRLVEERYQAVDGGLFCSDPHFWDKGTCLANDADPCGPEDLAALRATRIDGDLVVEELGPQPGDDASSAAGV